MEYLFCSFGRASSASAKVHGVTVREEIQKAIDEAWRNPPNDGGMTVSNQRKVPCREEVPTPEEVIQYILRELQNNWPEYLE